MFTHGVMYFFYLVNFLNLGGKIIINKKLVEKKFDFTFKIIF
jgi:hypothetical protein